MSADVSVSTTYNGKPLAVLAELIRQRQKYMGEDAKDAAAAMAINVCLSLRADTRVASARGKQLRIRRNASFAPAWASTPGQAGGGKRWIAARPVGGGHHVRAAVAPGVTAPVDGSSVFDYYIDKPGPVRQRLIIAEDEEDAMRHAPAVQRIMRHAGLARRLWGVLMSDLSGRASGESGKLGTRAESIARSSGTVRWSESDGSISVTIRDRLSYARGALKVGPGAIDTAVMRSANKVSGQLQRWAKSHWAAPLESPVQGTPFPEIVRKRKVG
jgi:hypothetical protein